MKLTALAFASLSLKARFAQCELDWIVPEWPAPPRVRAFMTTRRGQRHRAMDLNAKSADFAASRKELVDFLPGEPHWLTQVHGRSIVDLDADDDNGRSTADRDADDNGKSNIDRDADDHDKSIVDPGAREQSATSAARRPADGAITRVAGTVCAVRTADCLPLLLTDRAGSVAGAVHAGWRGLAAGVVEAAIDAMRVEPSKLIAWLGPAIGPAAFEVGADVRDAFCTIHAKAAACFKERGQQKWTADLYALARRRLARAGVGVGAVFGGDRCTMSEPQFFYSYRREREPGRMAALIWLANL